MEYFILDSPKKLNLEEIDQLYTSLARGKVGGSMNPKISAFLKELHSKYPHDTQLYKNGRLEDYPWESSDFEVSGNSVILSLSPRKPNFQLTELIESLCKKMGLLLYNVTNNRIH